MKFKFPKNIFSNTIFKNVLYLVSLALAVSYIINEQSLALISLIAIACGVYLMNKSVVIALFISIIVTNLLLSMNYLNTYNVYEGIDKTLTEGDTTRNPPSGDPPSGDPPSGGTLTKDKEPNSFTKKQPLVQQKPNIDISGGSLTSKTK